MARVCDHTTESGIPVVGQLGWGAHFCQFYRTREDLADILAPYFIAGLRQHEQCLWIASPPLSAEDACDLMREALPGFEAYLQQGQIEILDYQDWYLRTAGFSTSDVLRMWVERQERALEQGYHGLRLTGNTFWLDRSGWDSFMEYEAEVNRTFRSFRIVGLCTYSLDRCGGEDVLDVVRNHQFALARRQGEWDLLENASLKIAKDELRRLNEELEQRVEERTRELERALRGRDEFLAMLAHELRNPLAPIRNAAHVLRQVQPSETTLQWARELVDRQVQTLSRLVDDLLDVARITGGKVRLERERVEVAQVVARAIETVRPTLDRKGQTLEVSQPGGSPVIQGDATRLAQALGNLLHNASKYSPEGARIHLEVTDPTLTDPSRDATELAIRVRDEGVGISPEMLPHVFDLFTQADRSLDRSEGGLGVGLTLARGLIELHGGRIEVRSEGPGRGSEFTIFLPLPGGAAQEGEAGSVEAGPATGRRSVLVVDDNVDAAESLTVLLGLFGHSVGAAHSGRTALEKAAREQPDAVVLDIGLPDLDGYEVARQLRAQPGGERLLLIALTGYGREEDQCRSREAGFDFHMIKPADPEQLRRLLQD